MTHPIHVIRLAVEMAQEGASDTVISRRLGVARSTVKDWSHGRVPRRNGWAGCSSCGGPAHDFGALPDEYVYLLGVYLGDGCISTHRREVHKLRIALDKKYPGIIGEAARAMAAAMPTSKVNQRLTKSNCVEVYAYSKAWPCLFPQHGPGPKHERPIVLTDWQLEAIGHRPKLLLRGLIHSDGCRFQNTGRCGWSNPRYAFCNASEDIKQIFCDTCDRLDLGWTLAGERIVYVSRKADVARLDEFVGPKA